MIFLLMVIYIVFISLGLPDSLLGVAWPVLHTEFGIPESFASVFSIIVGICTGAVSFVAGKLIRKFGTGNVTLFSILLTAIGLIGISFSPNIFTMIVFSVILGYGAGAIDTGLNNFVSLHYKAHHMNWLHCFWGVGVTASPIIMSIFLKGETGSWRNGYRVIAAIQLIIAIIVLFSLKKWKNVEKEDCIKSVSNDKKDGNLISILKIKGVLTSIMSLGLYCSMEFLVGTWGATYFVNTYALSPDFAAKWISLYYAGIMLGRLVSGFIAMKANNKTMIRGGIAVSFLGMIMLATGFGRVSFFGLMLIGIGFGPIFPSVLHSIPERFGSRFSADITGFHMGGAYAIGFLTQLLFGFVAGATTFYIMPFVLIAICAVLFADNEITLKLLNDKK